MVLKISEHYSGDNKHIEWGIFQTGEGILQFNYITTSHQRERESMGRRKRSDILKFFKIRNRYHSHPNNTPIPSGILDGKGDIGFARSSYKLAGYDFEFKIYLPGYHTYISYDKNSKAKDFIKKRNRND